MNWSKINFQVVTAPWDLPDHATDVLFLVSDNWNDFGYQTAFNLFYFDASGMKIEIGAVKIADTSGANKYTKLPGSFVALGDNFASIGLGAKYYENLRKLPNSGYKHILSVLRDIAFSEGIWETTKDLDIVKTSLLRSTPHSVVTGQLRRIAQGGKIVTPYHFSYWWPKTAVEMHRPKMGFMVDPESPIPTNVHVVIGRNGVGKSYLFHNMAKALLNEASEPEAVGIFRDMTEGPSSKSFTGLVYVSFSAFDKNEPFDEKYADTKEISYARVGLFNSHGKAYRPDQSFAEQLHDAFARSTTGIISKGSAGEWRTYIRMLESDPGFADLNIARVLDVESFIDLANSDVNMPSDVERRLFKAASAFFDGLSSGHKIVLLALTRLIECVNEKTLVLIDEPEGHLHPPLLSAFIRVLSDLMTDRNGVAIVATHSPVVLQEVPKSCVYHLERFGGITKATRPEQETFGENVGVLTGRVFGYEVTESGFHQLIRRIAQESSSYEEAAEKLGGQLGSEAKAILMGLMISKQEEE
ncbi:MAG: ATP-binding protein [Luteolibacter sp.]